MLEIFKNNYFDGKLILVAPKDFNQKLKFFIDNKIDPINIYEFPLLDIKKDDNFMLIESHLEKFKKYKVLNFLITIVMNLIQKTK